MKERKNQYLKYILILLSAIGATIISLLVYNNGTAPLAIDVSVRDFFISIRAPFLNGLVIALTHCGDTLTIVALCAILLVLPSRKKYGIPVSLAALTGLAIYKPMKHLFLRARPEQIFHLIEQGGYSFPSGHSVTSVVVYGLLLYLIGKHCKNPALRKCLSAVCLIFALFIGPSRLYVGVHWFSDVVCGMLIGLMVMTIYILLLEKLEEKKH